MTTYVRRTGRPFINFYGCLSGSIQQPLEPTLPGLCPYWWEASVILHPITHPWVASVTPALFGLHHGGISNARMDAPPWGALTGCQTGTVTSWWWICEFARGLIFLGFSLRQQRCENIILMQKGGGWNESKSSSKFFGLLFVADASFVYAFTFTLSSTRLGLKSNCKSRKILVKSWSLRFVTFWPGLSCSAVSSPLVCLLPSNRTRRREVVLSGVPVSFIVSLKEEPSLLGSVSVLRIRELAERPTALQRSVLLHSLLWQWLQLCVSVWNKAYFRNSPELQIVCTRA